MPEYRLTWDIDVEASCPEEAAVIALEIQRRTGSEATIFYVDREGERVTIDAAHVRVCDVCGTFFDRGDPEKTPDHLCPHSEVCQGCGRACSQCQSSYGLAMAEGVRLARERGEI